MARYICKGKDGLTRKEAEAMVDAGVTSREVFIQQYGWVDDFEDALFLDDGTIIDPTAEWTGQCFSVDDLGKEYTYWPVVAYDDDREFFVLMGFAREPFY